MLWYRDTRTTSVPQLAAHMTHRRRPPDLRMTPDAALVLEEVLFTAGYERHESPPRSVPSAAPPQRLHGTQGGAPTPTPTGPRVQQHHPPVHHLETDNCNTVNRSSKSRRVSEGSWRHVSCQTFPAPSSPSSPSSSSVNLFVSLLSPPPPLLVLCGCLVEDSLVSNHFRGVGDAGSHKPTLTIK